MASITAVCRVSQLRPDAGWNGVTAIDKRPVEKPVAIKRLGVYGDVQADRVHHGGPDKAVYAFSDEDARHFESLLGYAIEPGLFGENLRTSGVDVTGAVIGERWHVGERLILEVTMPRTPCQTFARRMKEPKWVKRFTEEGRPGAYLRVVKSGTVAVGDDITVVGRPLHGVTIGEWFAGLSVERAGILLESARHGSSVPQNLLDAATRAVAIRAASGQPA